MLQLAAFVLLATTCNATLPAASVAATLPAASVALSQSQFSTATQRYSGPWKSDAVAEEKETRFVNPNTKIVASIPSNATHDKELRFIYRPNIETSMTVSAEIEKRSVRQEREISKDSPAEEETRFMKQNSKTPIKVPTKSHAERETRSLKQNTEKLMTASTDSPAPEEAHIPRLPALSQLRKVPNSSQLLNLPPNSQQAKVRVPSQFAT